MRGQVLPFRMAHATTDPDRVRREVQAIHESVRPGIGRWRRRRRLERGLAIAIALLILAQIFGTAGLAGLGAALVSVCVVVLALEALRRIGR